MADDSKGGGGYFCAPVIRLLSLFLSSSRSRLGPFFREGIKGEISRGWEIKLEGLKTRRLWRKIVNLAIVSNKCFCLNIFIQINFEIIISNEYN